MWPDLANFATLAKFDKSLAIFWRFIQYLEPTLATFSCYWVKVQCCKEAKYWNKNLGIWSIWLWVTSWLDRTEKGNANTFLQTLFQWSKIFSNFLKLSSWWTQSVWPNWVKFLVTNYTKKIAQMYGHCWAFMKTDVAIFLLILGKVCGTFYFNIWSHWHTHSFWAGNEAANFWLFAVWPDG